MSVGSKTLVDWLITPTLSTQYRDADFHSTSLPSPAKYRPFISSPPTPEQIEELADDLAVEKRNHEAARRSLEAKTHEAEVARQRLEEQSASLQQRTREVEKQSLTLAEMERASATAHEHNLALTRQIEEMTRLADERQAAAVEAAAVEAAGDGPAKSPERGGEADGERRKELEKLQQAVEMKTRQLAAVKERVRGRAGGVVCRFLVF